MVMCDKDVVLTPLLPAKLLVAELLAQPFLNYKALKHSKNNYFHVSKEIFEKLANANPLQ
jgi:hypothetical protein